MKCHPLIPLILAGTLLGATPALAGDHRPTVTIRANLGGFFPPPVVIVREPAWREVIIVEREGKHRHDRRHARWQGCDEREGRRERGHRRDGHRHDRREGWRGERIVIVDRGWERWD